MRGVFVTFFASASGVLFAAAILLWILYTSLRDARTPALVVVGKRPANEAPEPEPEASA